MVMAQDAFLTFVNRFFDQQQTFSENWQRLTIFGAKNASNFRRERKREVAERKKETPSTKNETSIEVKSHLSIKQKIKSYSATKNTMGQRGMKPVLSGLFLVKTLLKFLTGVEVITSANNSYFFI